MIVEFHPCFGDECLKASIEHGCCGREQAVTGGVDRLDVVEMNHVDALSVLPAVDVDGGGKSEDDDESQKVTVAECMDEARDGIAGNGRFEQLVFGYPSHGFLVVCHFNPIFFNRVAFDGHNVGYNDVSVAFYGKRVGQSLCNCRFVRVGVLYGEF